MKKKKMLKDILNQNDSENYLNHNLNDNKNSLEFTFAMNNSFTHSSQLSEYARKIARMLLFAISD